MSEERATGRMRVMQGKHRFEDSFGPQETTTFRLQMEFEIATWRPIHGGGAERRKEWRDVPLVDESGNELQPHFHMARWI